MADKVAPDGPRSQPIFDYATEVDPVMSTFGWKAIGLTYVALVIPILGALFPRGEPTNWPWFAASAVIAGTVGIINLIHYRNMVRSGGYVEPPAFVVLIEASIGTVATAMMAYAIGGDSGIYRPLLFVPTLLVAMIGNRAMIAVSWAVATASVTVVALASGAIDDATVAFVIAYGSTWGIASVMVHLLAMTSLHSDAQINGLAEAAGVVARSNGLADGIDQMLPVIAAWSGASAVAAYRINSRMNPADGIEVLGNWPSIDRPPAAVAPPSADELEAAIADRGVFCDDGRSMMAVECASGAVVSVVISEASRFRLNLLQRRFNLERMALQLDTLVSRSRYIEQLENLGRTDGLTGLPNRRGLTARLGQARIEAKRRGERLTLAMIDLDNFKDFNDAFGHVAGDELLCCFADELRRRLRAVDFVSRYGGEEFCMILPDTDARGAEVLFSKLHRGFREVEGLHNVTFSAGIAQWDGIETGEALINRADQALYGAKAAGRDRSVVDRGTD